MTRRRPTNPRICLLGASLETGNLGVNALTESSIKAILSRWPDSEIIILAGGYHPCTYTLAINDRKVRVRMVPIRFSKKIFLPYHFLWFAFYGLLAKILPQSGLREAIFKRNQYVRILYDTDLALDITGGDSFSDIYGMHRFVLGFLCKWLVMLFNKDLIMLPQTYGPFKRRAARAMARYVLNRANKIYSRDKAGVEYVNVLLGKNQNGKVRFVPDVAFVLDARKPSHIDIEPSTDIRALDSIVVGLNISGLLFNGGYNRNNMFSLSCDYRELIISVMEMLLQDQKVSILLISHVFPPAGNVVESDPDACLKIYEQLKHKYSGRIFMVKGEYDQGETKYIIGLCDFVIGSRMHVCIAALSQGICAVGLSYSRKFEGVFQSIGVEDLAVDMCKYTKKQIVDTIISLFSRRFEYAKRLGNAIPEAKAKIMTMFQGVML